MDLKIEKNVPIPLANKKQISKYAYLNKIIETWEVGDSVAFKCKVEKGGVKSAAKATLKNNPTVAKNYSPEAMSFCRRAEEADQKVTRRFILSEGVIRVWRIE